MSPVRVCVLFAAGTNCDRETAHAFRKVGATVDRLHINELIPEPTRLDPYQILVIPGGFTYGDYIAAGRVLASELLATLKPSVEKFIRDGKLVFGICNGFQVLVKAGILPGLKGLFEEPSVTLEFNDSNRFEDRWIYLAPSTGNVCVFTRGLQDAIYLPVAHAEGKLVPRDREVLAALKKNGQVVFQYVDASGNLAGYPDNPNGSVDNIAGICDPTGRIFGLMPHPERHVEPHHHPRWTRSPGTKPDGLAIFENGVNHVRGTV